MNTNTNWYVSI